MYMSVYNLVDLKQKFCLAHLTLIGEIFSVCPASDYCGNRHSEPYTGTTEGAGLYLYDVH